MILFTPTCEELEIFELFQQLCHDLVDVGLEGGNLSFPAVVLQVLDHLLHVVLQVDHVVFLGAKTGFREPVVEDDVNTTDSCGVTTFISISTFC